MGKRSSFMSKAVSKLALAAGFVLAMAFTFSCSPPDDEGGGGGGNGNGGSSTCSADFRTVTIGTQTWMAENLNCNVGGSKCYGDDPANCAIYGRLYNWATAMNLASSCNSSSCSNQIQSKHRGICPAGWHIPSDAEWDTLVTFAGGSSAVVTELKAVSGWNSSGNGTDDYGFSALPGGIGNSDGSFRNVGDIGDWWSATEINASLAYDRDMNYNRRDVRRNRINKSYLYSVRCIQN
jgi:uncharacterized protein (TIGR02145 family)